MYQTFANLVKNSFEAVDRKNGLIKVILSDRGKDVNITIEDNGKGMDRGTLKKVFEPEFTTKKDGMGFGMAYVKRIIEAHNGSIKIDSEVGKGTRMEVVLPYG